MTSGEADLINWLSTQAGLGQSPAVTLGIGDDMAIVNAAGGEVLMTTDMLLDGVHFDLRRHDLEAVGRKAIACSLSDCAAMAVRPVAATVSLALPTDWPLQNSQRLYRGMKAVADAYDCPIVGGDTTAWDQRLAIDVAMLGAAYPGLTPSRRSEARVGDVLLVTGSLGGSLLGRHMTFTPRVREARSIRETLGEAVHAMIDISDGLSLDLHRMCEASGVGAMLEEELLNDVIHADAHAAAQSDGTSPLQHALTDGEDFELLLAVDPRAVTDSVPDVSLHRVGCISETGLTMRRPGGEKVPLEPRGFEHLP